MAVTSRSISNETCQLATSPALRATRSTKKLRFFVTTHRHQVQFVAAMIPQTKILTVAAALSMAVPTAHCATNTPVFNLVGITTVEVAAKPVSGDGHNPITVNVVNPSVYKAVVPSVSTVSDRTVLSFPANTFSSGQFTGAAHYVELINGGNAGLTSQILSNTTDSITLVDNITATITADATRIVVRPNWTMSTAFPAGAGLQTGTSDAVADNVVIVSPSTGAESVYYYHSTNDRWQLGGADASAAVIPPDSGLIVNRRSTNSGVTLVFAGAVKTGPAAIYVGGDISSDRSTVAAHPFPMDSTTLADSGLYTTNASTGLVGGASAGAADTVQIINGGAGSTNTYFYHTGNNRWQNGGSDASSVKIPEGAAVVLTRRAGGDPFVWYAPQPAMDLIP